MEKAVWQLDNLLAGKTIESLIKEAKEGVERFCRHKDDLARCTPAELRSIIEEKEALGVLFSRISAYYGLKFSENTQDQNILAAMTKYEQEANDLGNKMLFFSIWFIHLAKAEAQKYITAPELADYKYYLEEMHKQQQYTKSEEIERIISIKDITGGGAIAGLYDVFTNAFTFDFEGEKNISLEEVKRYVQSQEPSLREKAYHTYLTKYGQESTLLTEMYKDIVLDWGNEAIKIRGYKDAIAVRNTSNDIPDEAVATLLKVIQKNNHVFIDYFKMKHALFQKKGQTFPFSRYHLYAPYPQESEKTYTYEASKALVLDTYKQFDERFYQAAQEIFASEHVHSHPQTNKKGGAFCYGVHTKEIPYILLNHTDNVRSMFTMMHEFGHGIHGMVSRKQKEVNYDAVLPMAETASIFGEMLLAKRMLKESQDATEKKDILFNLLENQYASITRQAYFVLFEIYAHEHIAQGISKEELDNKWMALLKEQFGDMELPEEFKHEWNHIPHIHASPFYCYAYAWGNLLVLSLFAQYEKEGDAFIEKYLELLSSGGNASPADLMKIVGADANAESFWQGGFDIIKEEIEELKKLIA